MKFEKTIELNPQDIYRYRLHANRNIFIMVVAFVFLIMAMLLLYDAVYILVPIICVVLITVMMVIILTQATRISSKEFYASSRLIQLPFNIKLDNFGVHTSNEIITANLLWQDFMKAQETKHAFYLRVHAEYCIIIPKRLLDSNEMAAIHSILIEKSPEKETSLGDEY